MRHPLPHRELPSSRRDFLARAGGGMGLLALLGLLEQEGRGAAPPAAGPGGVLAPRPPHFRAAARSVIWCFLDGGPSHIDLFDPKPDLARLDGKPLPGTFRR